MSGKTSNIRGLRSFGSSSSLDSGGWRRIGSETQLGSIKHAIKETDYTYIELLSELKDLKRGFSLKRRTSSASSARCSRSSSAKRDSVLYEKLVSDVYQQDRRVEESLKNFEEAKRERCEKEEFYCSKILSFDTSPVLAKSSSQFIRMCNRENRETSEDSSSRVQELENAVLNLKLEEKASDSNGDKDQKQAKKPGGTFIKRNVELAKNWKMTSSLTDEEKQKLQVLLADLDDDAKPAEDNSSSNPYKYQPDVQERMDVIDKRLEECIAGRSADVDLKVAVKMDLKKGWKEDVMMKRLNEIDEKLRQFVNEEKQKAEKTETTN